ncbi:ECF RNA polymerase sigma factor SigR [Streptomyces capoamus]|uniref:RNA polymerase sigma factor n=1 Tax=Streptomyces capoamus TaxID=68183 RepID=A0A919F434_9ACTN|nr:sigma-70 family RNA polymerase sigma factor [Streptomyces capoamus]GGP32958.1 ECF RNA polymerase sigma factor SigR [Streptomyces libani subsp. rufus]GHG78269.1 ECF RNA polymerase sigma factor SigR [Streptomyces capoamus]
MTATPTVTSPTRAQVFEAEALPYRGDLLAAARRLVRSPADAEDLLQETYLKAFRSFHQYRIGTNIRAWLHRILITTFINDHRRGRTRPRTAELFDEDPHARQYPASCRLASAEEQYLAQLPHPDIGRALRALPQEYAAVLRLADVEGLSYREIAEILGIAPGTVGSRVHRGRRRMRELIPHMDPRRTHVTPHTHAKESLT